MAGLVKKMRRLVLNIHKTKEGYAVTGRKTPCSSLTKVFAHIQKEKSRNLPYVNNFRVTIEEIKEGQCLLGS